MKVALTGATGFIGRYLVRELLDAGHTVRAWRRETSDTGGIDDRVEWVVGGLTDPDSAAALLDGSDALVHAALHREGAGFRGAEGDLVEFAAANVLGSLRLFREAADRRLARTVYVSTCAVHEDILDDRPLDERHPLWPKSHYGAHKAAVEAFVHSFGRGDNVPICAVRPSGVYGAANPVADSKWFDLVSQVCRGETVDASGGGKEVHAADVAKACRVLLDADAAAITGEAFSCCDRPIAKRDVAAIAKGLSGTDAAIVGNHYSPKHQIETGKLRSLGMTFGGESLLRETVAQLVGAAQKAT